jgi:hypothetical protein
MNVSRASPPSRSGQSLGVATGGPHGDATGLAIASIVGAVV